PDQRVVPGWRAAAGPAEPTEPTEPAEPAVAVPVSDDSRPDQPGTGRGARPGRWGIRRFGRPLLIGGAVLLLVTLVGVGLANLPQDRGAQGGAAEVNAGGGLPGSVDDPPQLASGGRAYTVEGATAFVRYWFATLNYATATGNDGPLIAASDPACAACATALQVVQAGYRNGRHLEGGGYTLRSVEADAFFELNRPTLNIVYDRLPRSEFGPDGQRIQTVPAVTFVVGQVVLARVLDQWRVRELNSSRPVG
ncbi:MAG: hypothetical protein J2P15_11480, partial [Micromonosporaceae bacterium]|nr:hypothetical protein [Micromonosporaceae bacterium]